MRWTQQKLDNYLQRDFLVPKLDAEADEGPESMLQSKIVAWCKSWGRPCLSFRQSKQAKGFIVPGWPDLTILMPKKRVIFIELKSKHGFLKKEQVDFQLQCMALDQEYHIVKSFKRFLEIVGE
jgi:hypothetical protein